MLDERSEDKKSQKNLHIREIIFLHARSCDFNQFYVKV